MINNFGQVDPYECNLCGERFPSFNEIRIHFRKEHGLDISKDMQGAPPLDKY